MTLTTNTYENMVAASQSQKGHLIMYLSRKLMSAEVNYSNIEKESLAIVWSTEQAQNFLLGKRFLLKSDLWNLYLIPEGNYQKSHLPEF